MVAVAGPAIQSHFDGIFRTAEGITLGGKYNADTAIAGIAGIPAIELHGGEDNVIGVKRKSSGFFESEEHGVLNFPICVECERQVAVEVELNSGGGVTVVELALPQPAPGISFS